MIKTAQINETYNQIPLTLKTGDIFCAFRNIKISSDKQQNQKSAQSYATP